MVVLPAPDQPVISTSLRAMANLASEAKPGPFCEAKKRPAEPMERMPSLHKLKLRTSMPDPITGAGRGLKALSDKGNQKELHSRIYKWVCLVLGGPKWV